MAKRAFFLVLGLSLSLLARPQGVVWSNVVDYPSDIVSTGDGWSATRADDVGSLRIAADDIQFSTRVRLDSMTYYSVQVGEPDILGGDLYVYEYADGLPGNLIAAYPDLPIDHTDSGWFNTVFQSNVYTNTVRPVGLELPAGRYFLAFRTVENRAGGAKNGALTTRRAIGDARAQWNFTVQQDGTVGGAWVPMEQFNLVPDQEWSFLLYGRLVVGPTSYFVNLGQVRSGDVSSLQQTDGNALQVCRFLVPNQQVAPVTVQLDGVAGVTNCSALALSVTSRMASSGSFSQTLDLWNWNTGNWDPTDVRTDAVTTSYQTRELAASGDLTRLLRTTDGALRARYRVRQTGPAAVIVWCHDVDEALWLVTP